MKPLTNAGLEARLKGRFLPLQPIRPEGRIFLSQERSKLCFEAPQTTRVPQNNLPLQGAGKRPPKSGFYIT